MPLLRSLPSLNGRSLVWSGWQFGVIAVPAVGVARPPPVPSWGAFALYRGLALELCRAEAVIEAGIASPEPKEAEADCRSRSRTGLGDARNLAGLRSCYKTCWCG